MEFQSQISKFFSVYIQVIDLNPLHAHTHTDIIYVIYVVQICYIYHIWAALQGLESGLYLAFECSMFE